MSVKNCPSCGKTPPDGANYCPHCGTALGEPAEESSEEVTLSSEDSTTIDKQLRLMLSVKSIDDNDGVSHSVRAPRHLALYANDQGIGETQTYEIGKDGVVEVKVLDWDSDNDEAVFLVTKRPRK